MKRPFPRRVFGIYDHTPHQVIGVQADGVTVLRQPEESCEGLFARAFAMTGTRCLFTLYEPARALPQSEGPLSCIWP